MKHKTIYFFYLLVIIVIVLNIFLLVNNPKKTGFATSAPPVCSNSASISKSGELIIQGSPTANTAKIYEYAMKLKKEANYDDFEACKYPAGFMDKCQGKDCKPIFKDMSKTTITQIGSNPAEDCGKSTSGTIKAESGLCWGVDSCKQATLNDAIIQLDKLAKAYSCPTGCTVSLSIDKVYNINTVITIFINYGTASADYTLKCVKGNPATSYKINVEVKATKSCSAPSPTPSPSASPSNTPVPKPSGSPSS
jgi:hypothetical protein